MLGSKYRRPLLGKPPNLEWAARAALATRRGILPETLEAELAGYESDRYAAAHGLMKKLGTLENRARLVAGVLRESGCISLARELEDLIQELHSATGRLEAVRKIRGKCHVKSLGDMAAPIKLDPDWDKKLERLSAACNSVERLIREAE